MLRLRVLTPLARVLLAVLVPLGILVAVEVGFFLLKTVASGLNPHPEINRFIWCGDCPEIYRNNPEHPAVDARGFRSCEDADAPREDGPETRRKILVLGDSVAFGYGVPCDESFPWLLKSLLDGEAVKRKAEADHEVVNAGVWGYGTYNEVQVYRHRGQDIDPDVVLLSLVLNDVANPRLHWSEGGRRSIQIPAAAIPNLAHDRDHARPVLEKWRRENRLNGLLTGKAWLRLKGGRRIAADSIPTHLTGEDNLPITVLTDPGSPESLWLKDLLAQLEASVRQDGRRLAVVVFPLSYQLDSGYPHDPQKFLSETCRGLGIPCLDLLPDFRSHQGPSLFLDQEGGYEDLWHLSSLGHGLAAASISRFLYEEGILPDGASARGH